LSCDEPLAGIFLMHEFSICQSLVEAVVAELDKVGPDPVRLLKTRVVVGGLRQVVPENLKQAYEILTKDTIAEGSALEVKPAPIIGRCEDCGWQGELPRCEFFCQACGSNKAEIVGGMELYLDNMEIETEEVSPDEKRQD